MKILQILPEFNVGGVERGTVDFSKYLIRHGHRAIVISNGGKLVAELEQSGVKHYVLPVHKKSLWSIIKMIKEVRKIIVTEDADIVHARSRVPAWIAYFACRKTKATFLTTCHGFYENRLFSQVMGWGKIVITPSEAIARHMIDDFGVAAENIRCIPRSVDLEEFNVQREKAPGQSSFVVSIVGRITPLKGHTYFIQAMAKVIRQMPYVKVWIIGDFPEGKDSYKQEVLLLVSRLGLKDNIVFWGNRLDIPELLAQTDCLVLSTITQEAFGRVILEAQAVGVPVVATRVGGVVDIIEDGKTGILVMPKDSDAMAKEVMRVLNDKVLAKGIVVEARKKLEAQYTLDHMASRTLEVYQELLNSTNILVIKLSSVGDVVLITASLRALRQKFTHAKIYCLVGKDSRKILQNCPYVDGLIIYDPKFKNKGWVRLFKLAGKLRKFKFDKIIDFQNNRRSHMLSFLSFPQESYGYDNGKFSFLLSNKVKENCKDLAPVPHQFAILKLMGIEEGAYTLELWLSAKDKQYADSLLESEWLGEVKNIVGINIAASAKWATKNWPLKNMAKLCDILASKNIRVIITGMDKDKKAAQELLSMAKSKPAIMVGKTDVMQLAALIEKCKVFITPDSAPMHVAAAVKTPFIAFFGPTDSRRHLPPAQKFSVIEKKPSCSPCYSSHCRVLTHVCMKDISPDEVVKKIESLIGAEA